MVPESLKRGQQRIKGGKEVAVMGVEDGRDVLEEDDERSVMSNVLESTTKK